MDFNCLDNMFRIIKYKKKIIVSPLFILLNGKLQKFFFDKLTLFNQFQKLQNPAEIPFKFYHLFIRSLVILPIFPSLHFLCPSSECQVRVIITCIAAKAIGLCSNMRN